ncbi:uncharacterized protein FA14DRAFT_20760 [Meira miltonrushii]|uniref:Uncharacterized protein n=1 Tax=Meira miltonrushii TaxID=1280837 RepID=A0A316VK33_9BASI|nr:uncharacterized protein FA14DRAFT_20760 [Meira miltonrushii]PWN37916.1 hypothetical protein FA14DRAFT_20760 [Meira miltonrushii]
MESASSIDACLQVRQHIARTLLNWQMIILSQSSFYFAYRFIIWPGSFLSRPNA